MLYFTLKILHILSAALLLGSLGYSIYLWHKATLDATQTHRSIQIHTGFTIIPFALFQFASGFTMISIQHYDFHAFWISGSIIGFITVLASWFTFIYLLLGESHQHKQQTNRWTRRLQATMLGLCTLSLLCMIFLMANKIT